MTQGRRPKGTGTVRRTPAGRYRALFAFQPGTREEIDGSPFATREEAERALDGLLAELRAGGVPRGVSLRKVGAGLLDLRERDGYRSVTSERQRWGAYVATWELVDVPIQTITRADVREWLASLAQKGLATQTRRNALNLLRAAFAAALEAEHIEANPCADLRVRERGSIRETSTHLTMSEAGRLIEASGEAWSVTGEGDPFGHAAVLLAIYTGLRQGELRSLLWEDVHENHLVVRYGKPGKTTKSAKIRRVPLLEPARTVLAALPRVAAMVLPTARGCFRPCGRIVEHATWATWLRRARITRRVRWHDLRHTCATLLLTGALGRAWSLEEVKEMLGHSSVRVTERYAKATGTLAELAAREMSPALEGARRGASEGATGARPDPSVSAQAREILERRGWDSNPRMTVLQTLITSSNRGKMEALTQLTPLACSYLSAVAAGDPLHDRLGVELAGAALRLAEALAATPDGRAETA